MHEIHNNNNKIKFALKIVFVLIEICTHLFNISHTTTMVPGRTLESELIVSRKISLADSEHARNLKLTYMVYGTVSQLLSSSK